MRSGRWDNLAAQAEIIRNKYSRSSKIPSMRANSAWIRATVAGLAAAVGPLTEKDKATLSEAGLYREKLNHWKRGKNLDQHASLITAIVLFRLAVKVREPGTDTIWVIHATPEQAQLDLPLD